MSQELQTFFMVTLIDAEQYKRRTMDHISHEILLKYNKVCYKADTCLN